MGFEPTISAGERPQTYALDRAATGTGKKDDYPGIYQQKRRNILEDLKLHWTFSSSSFFIFFSLFLFSSSSSSSRATVSQSTVDIVFQYNFSSFPKVSPTIQPLTCLYFIPIVYKSPSTLSLYFQRT